MPPPCLANARVEQRAAPPVHAWRRPSARTRCSTALRGHIPQTLASAPTLDRDCCDHVRTLLRRGVARQTRRVTRGTDARFRWHARGGSTPRGHRAVTSVVASSCYSLSTPSLLRMPVERCASAAGGAATVTGAPTVCCMRLFCGSRRPTADATGFPRDHLASGAT